MIETRSKYAVRFSHHYQEWCDLYSKGVSTNKIAKLYNCSDVAVSKALNKMGIKTVNPLSIPAIDRFNNLVIKKDGCWGWCGSISTGGYPVIGINYKTVSAHRFSYLIHKGEIGNMFVCHTCDNPICTNPDHLFLGTAADNVRDMINKGRYGTKYAQKSLSKEQAVEIKRLCAKGYSPKAIAEMVGTNRKAVYNIKSGLIWTSV